MGREHSVEVYKGKVMSIGFGEGKNYMFFAYGLKLGKGSWGRVLGAG